MMQQKIRHWLCALSALLMLGLWPTYDKASAANNQPAPDKPPPDAVRLIYFSSAPEIIQQDGKPGLAELATALRTQQEEHAETYFIFGGASLGPSLLGALDNGAHMVDILNNLQPEFMAVMKREFSYGLDQLSINAYASAFPFVTSNLKLAGSGDPIDGLEPYFLLETDSLAIGFIVITSENAINEYGATRARITETDTVVNTLAGELRHMGADAVFLMADTDIDDLSPYRKQGIVDGIFYTHNFGNPQSVDAQGSVITEGALDGYMMVLDLWHDTTGNLRTKAAKVRLDQFAPAPDIAALIESYKDRLQQRLSPPIATLATSFDTLRENVRSGENAFGNFVADAVRRHLQTDVFILNSGAIRGNRHYQAGDTINRGDIQRELPFGNRTAILSMSGAMLRRTIDHGLTCASRGDGCALQVSNMRVRYDHTADGAAAEQIWVGGKPLDDNKTYEVGMTDFMAAGNDGYDWLQQATPVVREGTNRALWDLIAEYCEQMGEISPTKMGRITRVSEAP